jgi:thymidylate kinase
VQNTKLILIEGIPGSGKSTLAQFVTHALTCSGIACRWCYEEEKDHPLYVFHDQASLQQTVDALTAGRYRQIIEAALVKWKEFSQRLQSSEAIVILDGCLFGYLTWSLFPQNVPADEIQSYLSQVEQIIHPLHPCLIYLYQQDVARALEKICERRGGDTRSRFIAGATQSSYGKQRQLQGFDGMVTFWKHFRHLIETAFSQFDVSKLALENSAGDWPTYEQSVFTFLRLPPQEKAAVASSELEHFVGTYCFEEDGGRHACLVLLEEGHLIVDGMPQVWTRTRLIPRSHNIFAVESLPFQVAFEEDANGAIIGMRATGPALLFGTVDHFFTRVQEPREGSVEDYGDGVS